MKYFVLLASVIFLLMACGSEKPAPNLSTSNTSIDLSDNEFVEQFNKFLGDIKNYSKEDFNGFMIDKYEKNTNTKLVYLFGEHHLDREEENLC